MNDALCRREPSIAWFAGTLLRGRAKAKEALAPVSTYTYQLGQQIGEGGMGTVYQAVRLSDHQLFAIKRARKMTPSCLSALEREVCALRLLQHAGIVRVTDHGRWNGAPWYAMELLAGPNLAAFGARIWRHHARWCARATMTSEFVYAAQPSRRAAAAAPTRQSPQNRPPVAAGRLREVSRVFRACSVGLAHVHAQGAVHGDLKPSNVILARRGPVLIDFGQCRLLGDAKWQPLSGGTVEYSSPEQAKGGACTPEGDLYALGCILYELTTGSCPFVGGRDTVLAQHISGEPLPPSQTVRGMPASVEHALLALLSKDPAKRPAALDALLRLLPA